MPYELITFIIYRIRNRSTFYGILMQIKINFEHYGFFYPLIFILDIISTFLWIGGIQLTIYYFTPSHLIISESLTKILTAIIYKTLNYYHYSTFGRIIIYILYLIIIFASLIYNEVIIINICSLSKNTRKKQFDRAYLERSLELDENNREINKEVNTIVEMNKLI